MSSNFFGGLRRRIRRAIGAETREGETLSGLADILRHLQSRFDALEDRLGGIEKEDMAKQFQVMLERTKEQNATLSNEVAGVRDQLIKDRTTFQEGLKTLEADSAKREREVGRVRDQLIKDRTTFQESLKTLDADFTRARTETKGETAGVRDQLIKDRTTFQEGLKTLKSDSAKRERELKSEVSGVRDQLIKDRTAYGEYLKRFEVKSLSKQREVEDKISPIPKRITGIEKQLEKTLKELREDKPVLQRIKESWLHPDYYYKNVVGLMEDRQRLLYKAIGHLEKNSRVLDIGPGNCFAMEAFQASGHRPVGVGLELESYVPKEIIGRFELVEADYNKYEVSEPYDAIWASHVLEHQPDKQSYVRKMFNDLKKDGWLFVLVPPMKAEVVGGHLNLFNTGYLLYTLVVGGFNCKTAKVTKYGYNVVVFVRKKGFRMPKLRHDSGDLETLAPYFPFEVTQNFNGLHLEINWEW